MQDVRASHVAHELSIAPLHVERTLEKALDSFERSNSQKHSPKRLHTTDRHPEKRHFLEKDQFINESGLLV